MTSIESTVGSILARAMSTGSGGDRYVRVEGFSVATEGRYRLFIIQS